MRNRTGWWGAVFGRALKDWGLAFFLALTSGATFIYGAPGWVWFLLATIGLAIAYYTWRWWRRELD